MFIHWMLTLTTSEGFPGVSIPVHISENFEASKVVSLQLVNETMVVGGLQHCVVSVVQLQFQLCLVALETGKGLVT